MYNIDRKNAFINECPEVQNNKKTTLRILEAVSKYEYKYDRDICTFDGDELYEVASDTLGIRTLTVVQRLAILKSYARWCLLNEFEGACDGFLKIDVNNLSNDKLKRCTIANPAHLKRYLDWLFESPSAETTDCIYRCYCWLAFSGMSEKQAFAVRDSDVDLTYRMIRTETYEYPIYQEGLDTFLQCLHLTRFVYKHPRYNDGVVAFKQRTYGNLLLRGTRPHINPETYRVELSRRQKNKNLRQGHSESKDIEELRLSYKRIYLSGVFYRAYEAERAGCPDDFTSAAEQYVSERTYNLDNSNTSINDVILGKAREYRRDYKRWKQVYGV